MKEAHEVKAKEFFSSVLWLRMLIGLIVGFLVISFFIFRVPYPKPEWGPYWRVQPLIVTPLFGALCGAGFHLVNHLLYRYRVLAVVLGIIGCIIGMWMGIVLGLHGTMWN